jgi:hypothetical protein
MDLTRLEAINNKKAQDAKELEKEAKAQLANIDLQTTVVKSFSMLVDYLDGNISKTMVVNQLKEIATPDALKVVDAVNSLHETLKTHENTDLTGVTEVLKSILDEAKLIPKELPEEKEDKDYTDQFKSMVDAIGSLEQIVKDKDLSVTVQEREQPAPVVNIDKPDLEPIRKEITNVAKCVKGIVIPEYKTDNAEVEKLLKKSNKLLSDLLDKPTGGGGGGGSSWVAVDNNGIPIPIQLDNGAVPITGSITASASTLADFSVNDIEDGATSYFGYTKPDGTWLVKSLTATSVSYATVTNNGAVTAYTDAWGDRAILTYGRFDEAF